jgi:uncharacterized protein (DUF1330 family)
MAVYFMNSYDIIDEQEFSKYGPQVIPLLNKYGAEVLASDVEGMAIEGKPRKMNAIIRFPSAEEALKCYRDPEYQPIKAIRHRSTANGTMVLVKEFKMG